MNWTGSRSQAATATGVDSALAALAAASTALLYVGFFGGFGYVRPTLALCTVGAAVGTVSAGRRWPASGVLMAAGVGFVLAAGPTFYRPTTRWLLPTPSTASSLFDDLSHAGGRMLSSGLPADPIPVLLVLPGLACWLAAFGAAAVARRTRSTFAPVAAPVATFSLSLCITASRPSGHQAATAMLLAAVLALALHRGRPARGDRTRPAGQLREFARKTVFGAALALGVGAIGMAAAVALPLADPKHRYDPRAAVPPPQTQEALTPLALVKRQLQTTPPRPLFEVSVDGAHPSAVDRLRTATLDRYDGVLWTSTSRYLVAGHHLDPADSPISAERVQLHLRIEQLPGPFLPTAATPTALAGPAVDAGQIGVDARNGALITRKDPPSGLAYTITALLRRRDSTLSQLSPTIPPTAEQDTALPDRVPPGLNALAAQLAQDQPTPYAKLIALERYLRRLPYSLAAPPGHSLATLTRLLAPDGAGAPGYAEQHAAAFALLARIDGFPTRIAVGYLLHTTATSRHVVTTRDAYAWPEVHFDKYGWVPFDPTDPKSPPRRTSRPQVTPSTPRLLPPPPPPPAPTAGPNHSNGLGGHPHQGAAAALLAVLWVSVALGALGVAAIAAIPALKAIRRRRRRRAATSAARISGAWQEAADRLTEHGLRLPRSATHTEAADIAAITLGQPARSLTALAPLAVSAVYGGGEPDRDTVAKAWHLERELAMALTRGRLSPVRRFRAALDPRPLRTNRSHRGLTTATTTQQVGQQ